MDAARIEAAARAEHETYQSLLVPGRPTAWDDLPAEGKRIKLRAMAAALEAIDGPKMWLLQRDEYYDSYENLGVITDPLEAWALAAAVAGSDDLAVVEVPVLPGVTVETLWSTVQCSFTIKWDGRTSEYVGDPVEECVVRGVPGFEDDQDREQPPACEVTERAMESGYTLGVTLHVWGSDVEQVRVRYALRRSQLIEAPAAVTIAAWVASGYLPRWTFGRDENHALLPALAGALRAAGKGDLVDKCVERGS